MPHLRCAFRRSRFPPISNRFPIYDAAATPAWTTVYGLPSLAATNIASRTTFVVCVPIASAPPPSLQGQASFANALRAITAFSVPHSVAQGRVPTPSGSCALRHGHPPRRGLRLYLRYRTASSRSHVHLPPLVKEQILASRLAPLWRRRPAYWRLFMPRFDERNTNCVKMQTDREIPAADKNHPYGVKSFSRLFFAEITAETARKPARIMRRGFQHTRAHARAQTASARTARHARTRGPQAVAASSRPAASSHAARFASSRQAVTTPRHGATPAALASRLAHYAHHTQRVTPRMRHASHPHYAHTRPARIMRTHRRARGPLRQSQVPITNRRHTRARSKCVAFRASASAGAEPCNGVTAGGGHCGAE